MLSKYYFGFNNKKNYFRASVLGFVNNFEQYFESCVLNTQNPFKGALNKVNGLITSKNQVIKIVRGFPVFEYAYGKKRKPRDAGIQQKAFQI